MSNARSMSQEEEEMEVLKEAEASQRRGSVNS